ncbi:hypothetical protein [Pseudomonas syringae]|uniref:hypothetical protein n=1 Tax=Pseudomonas syringae TaxID=317 RepID=UPI0002ADC476|nr:hypothetical protein [Pseudomonas syringae]ELS41258.1 Hypothetical protein PSSB64_1547 [Pseudomonas syringae pv. syringae B64]
MYVEDIETLALSPDGRYRVEATPWEAGNSHWVFPPVIIDTQQNSCVFTFKSSLWTADRAIWLDATRVELKLRKYPGGLTGTGITVAIDCARDIAVYGAGLEVDLSKFEEALDTMVSDVKA